MANKIVYVCVITVVWGLSTIALTDAIKNKPFTDICLGCICEAVSGCNQTAVCFGGACGLFHTTRAYWADGGKLTLNSEDPNSETAYANCANDHICAGNTVRNYMAKFSQDCNGDNVVDCYDYAAIHTLGPYACKGELPEQYSTNLNNCLDCLQNNCLKKS